MRDHREHSPAVGIIKLGHEAGAQGLTQPGVTLGLSRVLAKPSLPLKHVSWSCGPEGQNEGPGWNQSRW